METELTSALVHSLELWKAEQQPAIAEYLQRLVDLSQELASNLQKVKELQAEAGESDMDIDRGGFPRGGTHKDKVKFLKDVAGINTF